MTNESEVSFSLSLEGFPAMTATHRWFFRSSDDRTRVNSARQSHRKLFRMGILVTDHETRTHHINASPLHPSKMLDLQAHIRSSQPLPFTFERNASPDPSGCLDLSVFFLTSRLIPPPPSTCCTRWPNQPFIPPS